MQYVLTLALSQSFLYPYHIGFGVNHDELMLKYTPMPCAVAQKAEAGTR
jgi:hypothetical protein